MSNVPHAPVNCKSHISSSTMIMIHYCNGYPIVQSKLSFLLCHDPRCPCWEDTRMVLLTTNTSPGTCDVRINTAFVSVKALY